jgi:uncharacterized protein (DUF486 family)
MTDEPRAGRGVPAPSGGRGGRIDPANRFRPRAIMLLPPPVLTILLLTASNVFMTFAWYGHLKFRTAPMMVAILASWGIAFFEYLLQVPANRIGYGALSAAQLKTIQEVITLSVFAVFSVAWLGESLRWSHLLGFGLIAAGAACIFLGPK